MCKAKSKRIKTPLDARKSSTQKMNKRKIHFNFIENGPRAKKVQYETIKKNIISLYPAKESFVCESTICNIQKLARKKEDALCNDQRND